MWLWIAASCQDTPPLAPRGTVAAACPDPHLRSALAYDEIVIDAEGVSEDRRFWGGGMVGADFDLDGDIDLIAPGPWDALYLRNDGGTFVPDEGRLPTLDYSYAAGGAAADYDADCDLDVVITRWGPPDLLLRNEGDHFAESSVLPEVPSHSQSAVWSDLDLDGALDLVIAGHGQVEEADGALVIDGPGDPSRLYAGDGAGGLIDRTDRLPADVQDGYSYVIGVTELNGDGQPDLVVANDYQSWLPGMSAVFDGTSYVRNDEEIGLTVKGAGMGLAMADLDFDGYDDFVQPLWNQIDLRRSSAAGIWVESSESSGLTLPERDGKWVGWGADLVDIDNDMDLDLIVAFGHLDTIASYMSRGEASTENAEEQHFLVYLQQPDGNFLLAEPLGLERSGTWRGFVAADLDGNGWIDVARHDLEGPVVINLARCGENAWIEVAPHPLSLAVGARVTVRVAGRTLTRRVMAGGTSLNSGGPPEVHFGLGSNEIVDEIEVVWPDGSITTAGPLAARQRVVLTHD